MDSDQLVKIAANACDDRKALNIKVININEVSSLADWIIITEGMSDVQVRAIALNIENELKDKANRMPLRKEGINEAKWTLLDYGELIINIFQSKERSFYDLESFWSNGRMYMYKDDKIISEENL